MYWERSNMALSLWTLALALLVNLVLGAVLVLGVFTLMEQRILLGAIAGLVIGGIVVYAEATVGAQLFSLTFEEKRLIVVLAGIGAALGISGTMLTIEPEIN
ncbi:hypothetical protein E5139_16325 (plasmid) [Halomicrobium mukohataei]|uniref:Uncharacterized protein n=3 Tax=Halomicrobium mukohataei TaxID=57705 RepID=C7P4Z1_HALMD|nr:hypothetical protein Hmuk_3289 [Halomicrobium mukohataei DSM 12286]QCD67214.1 hypothetical protein E5139_16325 [Halomicrobium mukohataei]